MIVGIDHVQLACPPGRAALAAARDFYAGVLGLEETPKPAALATRGGAWFAGAVQIHLGEEEEFRPARKAHPALLVSDIAGLAKALETAGHAVRWNDELPGRTRCFVDDPFGNRIELISAE